MFFILNVTMPNLQKPDIIAQFKIPSIKQYKTWLKKDFI